MLGCELKQYESQYFEDCTLRRRLSDKTIKAYTIDLRHYFEFIGENGEDGNQRIVDYVHALNVQYDKPKTIKRKIASVKAFYAYLEYEGMIEMTPFHKIRTQIKEPLRLPKVISSQNITSIFQVIYADIRDAKTVCHKHICIRNAAVIELLFTTGIRISELCGLQKEDIDFKDKTM